MVYQCDRPSAEGEMFRSMDFEAKDFWFVYSHVGIHSGSLEFPISDTSDGCHRVSVLFAVASFPSWHMIGLFGLFTF